MGKIIKLQWLYAAQFLLTEFSHILIYYSIKLFTSFIVFSSVLSPISSPILTPEQSLVSSILTNFHDTYVLISHHLIVSESIKTINILILPMKSFVLKNGSISM